MKETPKSKGRDQHYGGDISKRVFLQAVETINLLTPTIVEDLRKNGWGDTMDWCFLHLTQSVADFLPALDQKSEDLNNHFPQVWETPLKLCKELVSFFETAKEQENNVFVLHPDDVALYEKHTKKVIELTEMVENYKDDLQSYVDDLREYANGDFRNFCEAISDKIEHFKTELPNGENKRLHESWKWLWKWDEEVLPTMRNIDNFCPSEIEEAVNGIPTTFAIHFEGEG